MQQYKENCSEEQPGYGTKYTWEVELTYGSGVHASARKFDNRSPVNICNKLANTTTMYHDTSRRYFIFRRLYSDLEDPARSEIDPSLPRSA